jgi:(p)ppGpp synthase/HD superfamily hydrolase
MTSEQLNVLIDQSEKVGRAAHRGQVRRDGGDYFDNHVAPVASTVEPRLKPIANLHDTVEDTSVTLEDLRNAGFPSYVIAAVDLLTHKNNEPNLEYWGRIAQNKDAATVKLADIKQNLSSNPSPRQVEKYTRALELFKSHGYKVD